MGLFNSSLEKFGLRQPEVPQIVDVRDDTVKGEDGLGRLKSSLFKTSRFEILYDFDAQTLTACCTKGYVSDTRGGHQREKAKAPVNELIRFDREGHYPDIEVKEVIDSEDYQISHQEFTTVGVGRVTLPAQRTVIDGGGTLRNPTGKFNVVVRTNPRPVKKVVVATHFAGTSCYADITTDWKSRPNERIYIELASSISGEWARLLWDFAFRMHGELSVRDNEVDSRLMADLNVEIKAKEAIARPVAKQAATAMLAQSALSSDAHLSYAHHPLTGAISSLMALDQLGRALVFSRWNHPFGELRWEGPIAGFQASIHKFTGNHVYSEEKEYLRLQSESLAAGYASRPNGAKCTEAVILVSHDWKSLRDWVDRINRNEP